MFSWLIRRWCDLCGAREANGFRNGLWTCSTCRRGRG